MLKNKKEMNAKIIFVVVFFFSVKNSIGEFNFLLKTFEIIKRLEIRHGIFVWDENHNGNIFGNVRNISNEGIMSTAMSYEKLIEYFEVGAFPSANTMIILKEINLLKIVEIFENFESIVQKAHRFTWIAFVDVYNPVESQKLNVPYNCRFLIACPVKENEYKFLEVYKVKNESFSSRFDENNVNVPNDYLYLRRMDLNGTEIVMNVDKKINEGNPPMFMIRQVEILNDIARIMNFHYRHNYTVQVDYVQFKVHGDLNDLPYPVHSYFFSPYILGPMFKIITHWHIKYPDINNRGDYIEPFHANLWICIFAFIILSGLILILMKEICKEKVSSVEVAFAGLDSLCYQDGSCHVQKYYFRIMIFTLRIIAVIIMSVYNTIIISYLAIREPDIPFKNLEEFSNDGSYLLAMPDKSFTEFYFKVSQDRTLQHIFHNLAVIFTSDMTNQTMRRFCNGKLALSTFDNHEYSSDVKCDALRIENPITFSFSGILLKNHSPFKEVWNYVLIRFFTAGIQKKLQMKTQVYTQVNPMDDRLDPVELKQVDQVLIVLGVGIILADVVFLLEIFWQKLNVIKKQCKRVRGTNSQRPLGSRKH